jgi:hypothetical protein
MASPFHVFRKHQKILMAVTLLFAMFAFVFLGPLAGGLAPPSAASADNPAVVTTKYGTFYEADMQRMVRMRDILNNFLEQAYRLAVQAGGEPTAYPHLLRNNQGEVTERLVVNEMLMAKRAEQLGFTINDASVNQYLQALTAGAVPSERLRELIQGSYVGPRQPVTMDVIFDALRRDLLASKLQETYQASLAVTPAESWRYYRRLNDRMTAQVLAVPVEDFLDQVKEPTDEELRAFFNQYKEQYDLPSTVAGVELASPLPGFRRPPRGEFAYVKADYDRILDQAAKEVTPEEVKKYYEENKRLFPKSQLLAPEPKQEPSAAAPANAPADPPREGAPPEPKAVEPSRNALREGAPPEPKTDEPAAEDQSLLLLGESQFVSLEADGETAPAATIPPAEGSPVQGGSPGVADETNAPAPVIPEQSEKTPPAPAAPPKAGEVTPPARQEPAAEQEYQPLAEVEETIRMRLAQQKAAQKVQEALRPALEAVNKYRSELLAWQLAAAENADAAPAKPAPPDMKVIAQKNNLEYGKTKLATYYELRQTPVGQSTVTAYGAPYADVAFGTQVRLYDPTTTVGTDGAGYAVWKTAERVEYVPEFQEVRDEVARAWKMVQARKLAELKAKELAERANEQGKPLAAVFPKEKVIETDPFSWLTYGAVPRRGRFPEPRLGQIEGVQDAGPAFMEQVFSLKDGEAGVAMNHPQTVAYVVQPQSHLADLEALRRRFQTQPGMAPQLAMMQNQQQILSALNQSLVEQGEVDWKRLPDSQGEQQ